MGARAHLRPMVDADIPGIIAIEEGAYDFPWNEQIFRDCLRVGYACWVVERGGALDAYGVMSVGAGESHILNLCVRPIAQRQGLGSLLLGHLLELARKHRARTALLEVRPSNRAAYRLYTGMGFNEVGIRHNYYPGKNGREDAVILAMDLA